MEWSRRFFSVNSGEDLPGLLSALEFPGLTYLKHWTMPGIAARIRFEDGDSHEMPLTGKVLQMLTSASLVFHSA